MVFTSKRSAVVFAHIRISKKHEVAAKEEKKAILIICDVFLRLISKLQEKQSCIPVRKTR